jgi:hypothetical protein
MELKTWEPCIVTMFDLVGTKSSAAADGRGSEAMIRMHRLASSKIDHALPLHAHGYIWNDSVLLLSYRTRTVAERSQVLAELDDFRLWLQDRCGAAVYAICVKGLAFPHDDLHAPAFDGQIGNQPRSIVLKTSSWAMANCFEIEKRLSRHRADWYIDSRVTKDVRLAATVAEEEVEMLPSREARKIQMFKGGLEVLTPPHSRRC